MTEAVLILASASPRRRDLLMELGLDLVVEPSGIDERLTEGRPVEEQVQALAMAKACEVGGRRGEGWPVVGADTLVVLGGSVLPKPGDEAEARGMLRALRGGEHEVVTGVAVAGPIARAVRVRTTRVWMRPYSNAEIDRYLARAEYMDKAGGYAIQDPTFHPVQRIGGCYCNVVGLPRGLLLRMLREGGASLPPIARPSLCTGCPDWDAGS